jgi:hypothetical protein
MLSSFSPQIRLCVDQQVHMVTERKRGVKGLEELKFTGGVR